MGPLAFPSPRDDDHEDVSWALTTALSFHGRGDNVEALRWVRKAVAAAVSHDRDGRAIELGRLAVELEEAFGVATTQRGQADRPGNEAPGAPRQPDAPGRGSFAQLAIDELDSPTYVDSRPASAVERAIGSGVDSEPTLVPFTQASAGAAASPSAATDPRVVAETAARAAARSEGDAGPEPSQARRGSRDTFTMPAFSIDDLKGDAEETLDAKDDPTAAETSQGDERTMPAMGQGAVKRWRVALLASADGDARVMVLRDGSKPPEGAALAMIIPATVADAQVLSALLGGKKGDG